MRRLCIESAEPGMKLFQPVYDEGHKVLLNRGVALTDKFISRLSDMGFRSVYISDPDLEGVDVDGLVTETTKHEAVMHLNQSFRQIEKIVHEYLNGTVHVDIIVPGRGSIQGYYTKGTR